MALLEVNGVRKVYASKRKNGGGYLTALDGISFELASGEVLGIVGPNGAGKSTLIKCITGLATQTSGEIRINGYDTVKEHVASIKKVGAIIEAPDMYSDRTAMENLLYLASISYFEDSPTKEQIKEKAESVLKLVNLYDRKDDKVGKFSLGMKQRLGIAQAIFAKPELLILDEPVNGLDPEGIKEIREIIIHLSHDLGMGVLVSSHNLSELQLTCDRFIIMQRGKIISSVSAAELETGGNVVIINSDDTVRVREILRTEFSLDSVQTGDGKVEVNTDIPTGDIAKTLILNGVTVNGISVKERTLEEVFMSLTSDKGQKSDEKEKDPFAEFGGASSKEDKDVR